MSDFPERFEMRRLEGLSSTIFGVAMTLLAYSLPKGPIGGGEPAWTAIWAAYQSQVLALLISFFVAGLFWISHQRRLAYQPSAARPVVYLNMIFLLTIILLPVTTGLYGAYGHTRDIVFLYCCHLAVLCGVNMLLWLLAGLEHGRPIVALGMTFATSVFVLAAIFAWIAPQTYIAQFMWWLAYAAPVIDGIVDKKHRRQAHPTP
jgi:uncharacterized membrane protein